MKAIKKILRSIALLGLMSIGLGLHELWADVTTSSERDPSSRSIFDIRTEPNRSEPEKNPPMDCVFKKYETICVRTNDRIEMDRYFDQIRKTDLVETDMYQQVIR